MLALFEGNKKASILFSILLAASAMRLLPVVGPIIVFLILDDYKNIYKVELSKGINKLFHYLSERHLILGLLVAFIVYVVATFGFGMPNQYTTIGDGIGRYAWVQPLTSHILLTFATDLSDLNWLEYHEPPEMLFRVLVHPSLTFLFLFCVLVVNFFAFRVKDMQSFAWSEQLLFVDCELNCQLG